MPLAFLREEVHLFRPIRLPVRQHQRLKLRYSPFLSNALKGFDILFSACQFPRRSGRLMDLLEWLGSLDLLSWLALTIVTGKQIGRAHV